MIMSRFPSIHASQTIPNQTIFSQTNQYGQVETLMYQQTIQLPQPLQQSCINCVLEPVNGIGGLYIGSMEAATNTQLIYQLRINSVITLCQEAQIMYLEQCRINHLVLPILDNEFSNLRTLFNQTRDFIDQGRANGNILVHCMVGVSRSATVILAYLMTKNLMTLEQALRQLISVRPIVNPNVGFITQLLEHERQLFGRIYSRLTQDLTYFFYVQLDPSLAPQIEPSYQIILTPQKVSDQEKLYNYNTTPTKAPSSSYLDSPVTIVSPDKYFSPRTSQIFQSPTHSPSSPNIFQSPHVTPFTQVQQRGWPVTIAFGLRKGS